MKYNIITKAVLNINLNSRTLLYKILQFFSSYINMSLVSVLYNFICISFDIFFLTFIWRNSTGLIT